MSFKRTMGVSRGQFFDLVWRVARLTDWGRGGGRPKVLSLTKAVEVVLVSLRQNLTQTTVAEMYHTSQSTVSRTLTALVDVVATVLDEFVPDPEDAIRGRATLVDGTLTPCWNWRHVDHLYSGKHRRAGHNHQVVCDLDGNVLHVSDPLPGATHDAEAFRRHRLPDLLDLANTVADKGYIGCQMITPTRKPPGRPLHPNDRAFNKQVNRLRAAVERSIAHLKTWRILDTPYRRPTSTYRTAFKAALALFFYALTDPFE